MHYAAFLLAAVAVALAITVWCCLRHSAEFGQAFDCEYPVSVPLQVRAMETRDAQLARRLESEASDEQRSPFPDEVDLFLLNYETIGA